jgi:hypothetical protein
MMDSRIPSISLGLYSKFPSSIGPQNQEDRALPMPGLFSELTQQLPIFSFTHVREGQWSSFYCICGADSIVEAL